jgi:hypothetical protein
LLYARALFFVFGDNENMAKKIDLNVENLVITTNQMIKHVANDVGIKLGEAYKTSIQKFYKDYPLKSRSKNKKGLSSYRRTYSLFKGVMGVGGFETYYKQEKTNCYTAGIFVDAMFIPGDPYIKRPPHGLIPVKAEIFERSFSSGIHGYTKSEIMSYNYGKNKDERYHVGAYKAPKQMKPSPEKILKTKYNEIAKTVPTLLEKEWEKYQL